MTNRDKPSIPSSIEDFVDDEDVYIQRHRARTQAQVDIDNRLNDKPNIPSSNKPNRDYLAMYNEVDKSYNVDYTVSRVLIQV